MRFQNFWFVVFLAFSVLAGCTIEKLPSTHDAEHDLVTSYISTTPLPATINKILFIGNSITLIPLGEESEGFHGGWGMYASAADKDYAHDLFRLLTGGSTDYTQMAQVNIWDFESRRTTWDGKDHFTGTDVYALFATLQPDLVVIQVGDNAASTVNQAYFDAYETLITSFGTTPVVCTSTIIQSHALKINLGMRDLCVQHDVTFVNCWDILENKAYTDLSSGIPNSHPNDLGMSVIAQRIYDQTR